MYGLDGTETLAQQFCSKPVAARNMNDTSAA
jgi:hypothetical protein